MQLNPKIVFPFKIIFFNEILPRLVGRTKQLYVLPTLMSFYNCKLWSIDVKS
jgi:hypothetical protein